jgi:type I restriction enzyme R subunit
VFSEEQRRWLTMIRDHVTQSLEIDMEDFGYTPFVERGGLGKAVQVFGGELKALIDALNGALAACARRRRTWSRRAHKVSTTW